MGMGFAENAAEHEIAWVLGISPKTMKQSLLTSMNYVPVDSTSSWAKTIRSLLALLRDPEKL